MEYLSLQGVFTSYASIAVREAKRRGYELDYSVESLNTVEEILDSIYRLF